MALPSFVTQPVGWAARAVGSAQNLLPGQGDSSLNQVGRAITDPNATLSNPSGLFNGTNAFTDPTQQPGYGAAGVGDGATANAGNYPSNVQGAYTGDPSAVTSAANYAAAESGVNSQLGRLDNQFNIGNQNINDAYTTQLNSLNGQKAITDRNYQTSKDQTLQDNVAARGNIQASVGQNANSLQRLLGSRGAGSSSAAQFAAPYAAARTGALQNQQVQQTYGRNQQALDTNYGDYNNQFKSTIGQLDQQKKAQGDQLKAQVAQNRSSLLTQLANIAQARGNNGAVQGYQDQVNALGGQIDSLGQQYASPVLQATAPTYNAPTLDAYNYEQAPAAQLDSAPGAGSNLGSFLSVLLGAQDKNKGKLL